MNCVNLIICIRGISGDLCESVARIFCKDSLRVYTFFKSKFSMELRTFLIFCLKK